MTPRPIALALAALLLGGCAYNKETVPVSRGWVPVRAANQQRVVANAVDDAVNQLDLAKLSGKSVVVELAGVLPHTGSDLLDYVRDQVEGRAARAGARIVEAAPGGAPATADYRLLVAVSWGGIDTRVKVVTDEPRLSGQVALAVGGVLAGFAVQNAGNSSLRYVLAGGKSRTSTLLMIGGPAGAALWAAIKPPFVKTTTLIGRCHVMVNADPISSGVAFSAEGDGTSRIVIDDGSQEGYQVAHDGSAVRPPYLVPVIDTSAGAGSGTGNKSGR